jgi:predicted aconitase/predicted aconitase with swiveling domain
MNDDITQPFQRNRIIVSGDAGGEVLVCQEGLSFWGGVDPETGKIIDAHHPNHGDCIAGKCLMMPTSRGSCSGSGVLLQLALNHLAPAMIIFNEMEQVLTLGSIVCDRIFSSKIPIIFLTKDCYAAVADEPWVELNHTQIQAGRTNIVLEPVLLDQLNLSANDQEYLRGDHGEINKAAMETILIMGAVENAPELVDVEKGHIDGCILAHNANLIFAEKMVQLGAKVKIPTTINAISVDRENWQKSGLSNDFGSRASRLAQAYVDMGVEPTFTCAPYLLSNKPKFGQKIGWSESNAVIFANTVLGARTQKHPDYLDLFIAMTGRAPAVGVYSSSGRAAKVRIHVDVPNRWQSSDEVLWPLIGWLAGKLAPDSIPLLTGLENLKPSVDDLKSLCAAFGTTSGAPMLHILGHTPEASDQTQSALPTLKIKTANLRETWLELNRGIEKIDLVAIGSPHASIDEIRRIKTLLGGRKCHSTTHMKITTARDTIKLADIEGITETLEKSGVHLMPDMCWCSIVEPIFPIDAKGLMTNSGKYAHYAHGLSNRHSRLGSLEDCVNAAVSGYASLEIPCWLEEKQG